MHRRVKILGSHGSVRNDYLVGGISLSVRRLRDLEPTLGLTKLVFVGIVFA